MIKIIIGVVCIILGAYLFIFIKRNKKIKQESINNYLISTTSPLYKYIKKYITKEHLEPKLNNLISYDLFKEECISDIYNQICNINKSDIYWLDFSLDLKEDDVDMKTINSCVLKILNSSEINELFLDIFSKKILENIDEAQKIEIEAIKYHKSFGEEPDGKPELHSKEPSSYDSSEEDLSEKTLEELSVTGTVEDI